MSQILVPVAASEPATATSGMLKEVQAEVNIGLPFGSASSD